jgi:hypothetical protein
MDNDKIMKMVYRYEEDKLSRNQEIYMFSVLLETGLVWKLKGKRGFYGERAIDLIKEGVLEEPRATETKDLTK